MADKLTEKQLSKCITDHARKLYGYELVYHTFVSMYSARGFPDLVLTRSGDIVFAELKAQRGRLSPYQGDWRNEIEVAQERTQGVVRYFLWRPSNWYAGEIEEALR